MNTDLKPNSKPEPTKSELEILQVLWLHGKNTVRFVNDELRKKRDVQYTSTLKLMQIMHEKGFLIRDDSAMKHLYAPAVEEQHTKSYLLEKFIDSMYQGSAASLMVQLLGNRKVPPEEIEAIKLLMQDLDDEIKPNT
jgi:BlaI family transcriptional regulator, penicillinase repressor